MDLDLADGKVLEGQHPVVVPAANRRAVLLALAWMANARQVCWPSHRELGRRTGLQPHTLRRALYSLQSDALVAVLERPGSSNAYRLTLPPLAAIRSG